MAPTGFVILLGFAILFWRKAEDANRSGIIWGGISALSLIGTSYLLSLGFADFPSFRIILYSGLFLGQLDHLLCSVGEFVEHHIEILL